MHALQFNQTCHKRSEHCNLTQVNRIIQVVIGSVGGLLLKFLGGFTAITKLTRSPRPNALQ